MDDRSQGPQADMAHHGRGDLADHLSGMPGHNGGSQDLVGPAFDENLHEPFCFPVQDGPVHLA